jgi:lysine-specific demethylase 8
MTVKRFLTEWRGFTDGRAYLGEVLIDDFPGLGNDTRPLPYYSQLLRKIEGDRDGIWIGQGGCRSALHVDPKLNFATQIVGRKKWTIFPSDQNDLLYIPSKHIPRLNFSPINMDKPDLLKYPKFKEATPIEFILSAGEVLFLPLNWAHYVYTLEFSISMSSQFVTPSQIFSRKIKWYGGRYYCRARHWIRNQLSGTQD